jgi:hypothetical protein
MASDLETWGIIAGAASPVLVALIGARLQAYRARHHAEADAEETAQDRLDREEELIRKAYRDDIADLRARLITEQSATREAQRDRDRGWWLARWWEAFSHSILRIFRDALAEANGRLASAGLPQVAMPAIKIRALEDPKPGDEP